MGAHIAFFSPLNDRGLPECDALWLPGGYPELHLEALSGNRSMRESIRRHHAADKPILAECGGMLYCLEELQAHDGTCGAMAGILAGKAVMQPRLTPLGLQQVDLEGETLRGHTFHHSRMQSSHAPMAWAVSCNGRKGEPVFRSGPLIASYLHFYFPSSGRSIAQLLRPG